MIAHNYVNLRRIRYYFHYCAISYQRDNRDVSHVIEHGSLKLTIPAERPIFSPKQTSANSYLDSVRMSAFGHKRTLGTSLVRSLISRSLLDNGLIPVDLTQSGNANTNRLLPSPGRSSGVNLRRFEVDSARPVLTATYCCPATEKLTG